MRAMILSLTLVFAAPAGAEAIGEPDTARPGGAYSAMPAADPAACALACARDALCMAWTFRPAEANACELKAVIPALRPERGATSGLSARAPAFARAPITSPAPVPGLRDRQAPPALASPALLPPGDEELLGGPLAITPAEAPPL